MTALTITEVSSEDVPMTLLSGTGIRRVKIYVRGTCTGGSNTVDLATYVPALADIEGVEYSTDDNAIASSALTWSTTTLTVVDSGAAELCVVGTLT